MKMNLLRYANGLLLALTLVFATGFLLSNYRAALADPAPGTCANVIDSTYTCPLNTYASEMAYYGWHCRLSAPYGTGAGEHHCCRYESEMKVCYINDNGRYDRQTAGQKYYFRSQTAGDSSCLPNSLCTNN